MKDGTTITIGAIITEEMSIYLQMLNRRIELFQLEQFLQDGRIPIVDPSRIPENSNEPVFLSIVNSEDATDIQKRLAVNVEPNAFIELKPDSREIRLGNGKRFEFGFEVFRLDQAGNKVRLAKQPFVLDENRIAQILAENVYDELSHILEVYVSRGEYNKMIKSIASLMRNFSKLRRLWYSLSNSSLRGNSRKLFTQYLMKSQNCLHGTLWPIDSGKSSLIC